MENNQIEMLAKGQLGHYLSMALLKDYCREMSKVTGENADTIRNRIVQDAAKLAGIPIEENPNKETTT